LNTEAMAKAYLEDAEYSLREAKIAAEGRVYHRVVRRAQECVELALKAVLRLVGIEYPREHEISTVLMEVSEKKNLPGWFTSALPEISVVSKRLTEERGPAFYGEEKAFVPPGSLYGEKEAGEAITDAEKILNLCKRFFEEWKS